MRSRLLTALLLLLACVTAYAQQTPVNTGTGPNTGTGDPLRTAFTSLNANDALVFGWFGCVSTSTCLLSPTYGGTGVNNGSKTITLGASLITSGAGAPTLAFPSTSFTYTFPGVSGSMCEVTTGTFTGTITAGTATNTGTLNYEIFCPSVTNGLPVVEIWTTSAITVSANAGGNLTLSGLPTAIQPAHNQGSWCGVESGGATDGAAFCLISGNTITFAYMYAPGTGAGNPISFTPSNWAASGTSGLTSPWAISYANF